MAGRRFDLPRLRRRGVASRPASLRCRSTALRARRWEVSGSRRLGPRRLVERCVLSVAGPHAPCPAPGVLPSDPGGHVDLTSFIALLNEDLQTEFQSVVQYVQHTAAITGPEYLSGRRAKGASRTRVEARPDSCRTDRLSRGDTDHLGPRHPGMDGQQSCFRGRSSTRETPVGAIRERAGQANESVWRTWPKQCDRCSSRPRNTSEICKAHSAGNRSTPNQRVRPVLAVVDRYFLRAAARPTTLSSLR